jgi:hypothetical protein
VLDVLRQKKLLKDKPVSRVVFNAITKSAITEAMQHPRDIDAPLVDAYLARRALDYLVGFTLSPILWRKLPGSRSAGRVQSVALRLVCDRESEIERFKPQEYWSVGPSSTRRARASRPGSTRSTAEDRQARHQDRRRGRSAEARHRGRQLLGRLGRQEADQAQPLRAVHHLEPAAGCLVAARLLAVAHHADRPAPLRGRHHHLHAYRRRADGAARRSIGAPAIEKDVRHRLPAADAAHLPDQGQERAGSARGDPADRHVPAPRYTVRATRTSASSTS